MIIKKKKEGRKEVEKGEKNANEGLHSVNFRFEFWTGNEFTWHIRPEFDSGLNQCYDYVWLINTINYELTECGVSK